MAAYLPEEISNDERKELSSFMHTLGKFYPCDVCAHELNNRWEVVRWVGKKLADLFRVALNFDMTSTFDFVLKVYTN